MNASFGICIAIGIVGFISLIYGSIVWDKGKPHGVNSMVKGAIMVLLAVALANGERHAQLTVRVATLEAQLAKQSPAAQNSTAEQK